MPRSYFSVEPRVRRLVAAHLGVDPGSLAPDADLHLDAPARRGVAQALERTFRVELEDPAVDQLRSCRDLSRLVAQRVAERSQATDRDPPPVWVRVIPSDPSCPVLERL